MESFVGFVDFFDAKIAFWYIHSWVNYKQNSLQDWSVKLTWNNQNIETEKGEDWRK